MSETEEVQTKEVQTKEVQTKEVQTKEKLITNFTNIFGENGKKRTFFTPGRVNLIGEHTDYNGGFVFPCAITLGTYAVVSLREDGEIHMYSENFPEMGMKVISLEKLKEMPESVFPEELNWSAYPLGMIKLFLHEGYDIDKGMNIYFYGNLPNGSGLSSSASIEVLTGFILKELFDLPVDNESIALLAQKSENIYNGVKCGIMDQFAVAMGRKDKAIFLNTSDLNYEYVPLDLKGNVIVICQTNKVRKLGESKYNERRSQCEEAFKTLTSDKLAETVSGIKEKKTLCDFTLDEYNSIKNCIEDEVIRKMARHAISENERTKRAVEVLKEGDLAEFGKLMNESHISLRDDYEVTGRELDTLFNLAGQCEKVCGARMTGAGFGGCALAVVDKGKVKDFTGFVGSEYEKETGLKASFYVVTPDDGPREL